MMFVSLLTAILCCVHLVHNAVLPDSKGNVVQILNIQNGTFVFYEDDLSSVLSKIPSETEVGIVSIAGEYRKGKSFLLNYFLQYLRYREEHDVVPDIYNEDEMEESVGDNSHPWLRDIQKNEGFQFKSGIVRETTGINIWSEPFQVTLEDGKKVAILVMDSQGLYDQETSANDNTRLFTMVALLSSTLMLNTPQNLNFNQLNELKYFLSYANSSTQVIEESKLFQTLSFIIRDYDLTDDHGYESGQAILRQFLQPSPNQPAENRKVVDALTPAFSRIEAFTLPRPGKKVIRSDFDGRLVNIDTDFLVHLQNYTAHTIESMQPRHPLLYNLTPNSLMSYVKQLVTCINKNLPPDEIIRLQETQLLTKVTDTLQSLGHLYADNLIKRFIDDHKDSFFLKQSDEDMARLLSEVHMAVKSEVTNRFKSDAAVNLVMSLKGRQKPLTALAVLEEKIQDRFNGTRHNLLNLSAIKRKNAVLFEEKIQAIKDANSKRLQEIQREFEENLRRQKIERFLIEAFKFAVNIGLAYLGVPSW